MSAPMTLAEIWFWTCLGVGLYPYVLYPLAWRCCGWCGRVRYAAVRSPQA